MRESFIHNWMSSSISKCIDIEQFGSEHESEKKKSRFMSISSAIIRIYYATHSCHDAVNWIISEVIFYFFFSYFFICINTTFSASQHLIGMSVMRREHETSDIHLNLKKWVAMLMIKIFLENFNFEEQSGKWNTWKVNNLNNCNESKNLKINE